MTSTLTVADVTERVTRGARLLDEFAPDWAHVIDLGRLDLSSGTRCVLGQVGNHLYDCMGINVADFYGIDDEEAFDLKAEYNEAISLLEQRTNHFGSPADFGFDMPYLIVGTSQTRAAWEMLRCAWIDAIVARRLAADAAEMPYIIAEIEGRPALTSAGLVLLHQRASV
jgi:hypothetical protein